MQSPEKQGDFVILFSGCENSDAVLLSMRKLHQ